MKAKPCSHLGNLHPFVNTFTQPKPYAALSFLLLFSKKHASFLLYYYYYRESITLFFLLFLLFNDNDCAKKSGSILSTRAFYSYLLLITNESREYYSFLYFNRVIELDSIIKGKKVQLTILFFVLMKNVKYSFHILNYVLNLI